MDIQLPLVNLLPSRPEIKGITGLLAQLTPGQQIDAVVESQIGDNYYLLRMSDSGLPLRARTPVALEAGRSLTLQVMESGDTPKLRIVSPQQAPVESADSQAIQQALREFLPKRLPAGQLAATLERLLGAAAGESAAKLPQPVRTAVAELARALPQSVRLANAEGLQQAVRDSGLFLEAKLATAAPGQARELAVADLKSRLLVLVDALRKQLEAEGGGDDAATEAMDLPEDYRPQPGSPAVAETGGRPLPRPSDQGATPQQNAGARLADTADASPERRLAVVSESALPPSARTESAAQPVPVERSSAQSTE
ncbi:MAG: hypothetical protein FIA97_14495, partial [Methylococcaceae bacterium]|nr:hypothetical protein [Methylococcaceae bacterium]